MYGGGFACLPKRRYKGKATPIKQYRPSKSGMTRRSVRAHPHQREKPLPIRRKKRADKRVASDVKRAVRRGRSNIVGKPLAALLMQKGPNANATVTVAHSKSEGLRELCQEADILVAAMGSPHFVGPEMVGKGATVVDVGINRLIDSRREKGYRVVGDVDFERVQKKCYAITPVPGGIGPMTVASLLQNTLTASLRRCS